MDIPGSTDDQILLLKNVASSARIQNPPNSTVVLPPVSQHELKQFANEKKQTLAKMDKSVKGEIDAPILELTQKINSHAQYYTTSSCSGRIIVTASKKTNQQNEEELMSVVMKKGTDWKFVSHEPIEDADTFVRSIKEVPTTNYDSMILKFEPVIFHIRALNATSATALLQVALQSGFRNSGIVFGSSNGRATVAFRHTAGLEVPLIDDGQMIAGEEYLKQLVKVANRKMAANGEAIRRLEKAVKEFLGRM